MNVITMHYCGDMCQILCFVLPGALLPIDKESPYLNKEYCNTNLFLEYR